MKSKSWGIVGAVFCVAGYQLLKYGVGKASGYMFAALIVLAWAAVTVFYRSRLAKLRHHLSEMTPEQRERALAEIDLDVREDLKKHEKTG